MNVKLVADSSANAPFDILNVISVPLKIITDNKEYVDDQQLNVAGMLKDLRAYKGRSSTACPSVNDWMQAFDGADIILGVAITSNLSGTYQSSLIAAEEYTVSHPGAKIFILDSLSTGPEMQLILEKYKELTDAGKSFEEIQEEIKAYLNRTHLLFALSSLDNFAKNGRINPAVAKAVGILGIRVVGRASSEGTLEPMHKCRGEKKALQQLLHSMREAGYQGGKVRLSHSYNPAAAETFSTMLREAYPGCDISICCNRGLCCYYAEEGSLLVGFES